MWLSLSGLCRALLICLAAGVQTPAAAGEHEDQAQRQLTQPGNNTPMWREVRSGKTQSTKVHGIEAGVLVQSGGQTWRLLRPKIASAGSALLWLCIAVLALFYWWRGPIGVSSEPTGRLIERFDLVDRVAHWGLGISFVALAITGLTLSFGKYLLLPVIGYTLFSLIAVMAKTLHNLVGPIFAVCLLFFILRYARDNLPKRHDIHWMMRGGGLFTGEHVPSGRFNAGEKTLFWGLVCGFCAILSASGFVLDFPNFEQGRAVMQIANIVHWIFAFLAIAASLFHIYLGSIGMKGAYDAMRDGCVDETWAKEHHEIWYEEVKAGKSKQHLVGSATSAAALEKT